MTERSDDKADKPADDRPSDGTVIISGGPPKLQPRKPDDAASSAQPPPAGPAGPAGKEEEGIPAPPIIKPKEGAPASPPSSPSAPAASPASPAPTPAAATPAAVTPAATAPPADDDDDDGDVTQVLRRSEPPRESTVILAAPPPSLGAKPKAAAKPDAPPTTTKPDAGAKPAAQPSAVPNIAAKPSAPAQPPAATRIETPPARSAAPPAFTHDEAASAADETRTIMMRSPDAETVRWDEPKPPWMSLERILPAEHAGVVQIDKKVATVGRALDSDVRLYSASASRQHARIEQKGGAWILVPIEGRRVIVDGESTDGEVELQPGMRLALGDDELLVADQEDPDELESETRRSVRPEVVVLAMAATAGALYVGLRLFGYL